jgi:hypothetical protein
VFAETRHTLTSEELILLLDRLQPTLPKCANAVLLRLVSKCITSGTNEVDISAVELARELNIAADSVKVAKRALTGIVETRGGKGISTVWMLPSAWFVVQRSLFAIDSPVENWGNLPGNQGTPPWKPGHQPQQKPGSTSLKTREPSLETRAQWTSFQGGTSTGTREVIEENQQDDPEYLPGNQGALDRSNRILSSVPNGYDHRDSIETVNHLPAELTEQAEDLRRWLRGFFGKHHPAHTVPNGPDEIILAKCLAIAPVSNLVQVLQVLHRKNTRPGDTWAWFVTVFCQRIHRTQDLAAVKAPAGFHQGKKDPSSERQAQFSADLLQQTTAAARTF